jgi:hypothetical protein
MDCPRCGQVDVTGAECPRCGVLVAKARSPRTPRASPSPAVRRSAATGSRAKAVIGVLAAWGALLALVAWFVARPPRAAHAPQAVAPAPVAAVPAGDDPVRDEPPADLRPVPAAPPEVHATREAQDLTEALGKERDDARAVAALAERIDGGRPIGPEDLRVAEDLFARYPDRARGLLESALVTAAFQARRTRRFAEARDLLSRAIVVSPGSANPRRGLMDVLADLGDWAGVEAAARGLLGLLPEDAGATKTLAYAMVRQDRTPDAIEALRAYLSRHADPEAASILEKLQHERQSEGGFEEQRLAHFHVRYDGEEHADVGREILRVLDRHYATLRGAFDREPAGPVPVILFSTHSYYDATGAPAWSGGEYDHFDGRIRVPIGGLSASLSPELESTLLHELTHAFVTDASGGVAPREIQEGLAQWTEGRRSEEMLGEGGLRALADGRVRGVTGFYLASLVLVEDLVAQRGRGGINDLLAAMNRTRDVDAAFQEVYGRSFTAVKEETVAKLRQRHGS